LSSFKAVFVSAPRKPINDAACCSDTCASRRIGRFRWSRHVIKAHSLSARCKPVEGNATSYAYPSHLETIRFCKGVTLPSSCIDAAVGMSHGPRICILYLCIHHFHVGSTSPNPTTVATKACSDGPCPIASSKSIVELQTALEMSQLAAVARGPPQNNHGCGATRWQHNL
jgi:hypothetical protein